MRSAVGSLEETTRLRSYKHNAIIGRVDSDRVGTPTEGYVGLKFLEFPIDRLGLGWKYECHKSKEN
jgi:hypothetical protein